MHLDLEPSALQRHAAAQLRQRRKELEGGPLAWIVPRAVSSWVFGLAVTLVLPGFLGGGLGIIDFSATSFWLRLLGPAFVAATVVPAIYVMVRRSGSQSVEELVREWEGQWTRLTLPGWWRRVLGAGALMAAGIGVPVGTLMALLWPVSDLLSENRFLSVLAFTLLTAGWTLPLAFVARWAMVASFRTKGLLRPSHARSPTPPAAPPTAPA